MVHKEEKKKLWWASPIVFGPRTLGRTWAPVWSCGDRNRLEGEACGIPHLAKNERDVGHPAVVAGMEPKRALAGNTLPGSTALPFVISTGAQRSGEICGFFFRDSGRFAPAAATRRLDVQDVALGQVLTAFAG
jgi:hypothetical protein